MGLASLLGRPQGNKARDSAHKESGPASHKRKQQPVNEYAVKLASTKRLRVSKPKAAVPVVQQQGKQRQQQGRQRQQQQKQQEQQQEDEDGLEEPVAAGQSAYEALMGAFAAQKGEYGVALRQRRQEAEGYSDTELSGSDSEEEQDEGELSDLSGSDYSGDEQGNGFQLDANDVREQHLNGREDEQHDQAADDDGHGVASDEDHGDKDGDQREHAEQPADGPAAGPAAAASNGVSAQRDTWQSHFGRMLSEAEVAALQQGRSASQFVDAGAATAAGSTPAGAAAASPAAASAAGPSTSTRAAARAVSTPSAAAHETGDGAAGGAMRRVGAWKQGRWQLCGCTAPEAPGRLAEYGVKERLRSRWAEVHEQDNASRAASGAAASTSTSKQTGDFANSQQRDLFALANSYCDILLAAKPYPMGDAGAEDALMDAVLLHVLNHVAKSGDRVKKNNEKLKADGGADASPRDQGFTRPKVLILLPMRNVAFNVVRRLVALAQRETRADSVQGKEKFVEQFTDPEADAEAAAAARKGKKPSVKPQEHRALFSGNTDDHFRLGIKITRGAVRLFADLFQSDIIVASPIALATKLAEAGARDGADSDFLSSIEMLVLERADVMLMQNWQHVVTVLESLNRLPKQQHGGDIMRVHEWALAGLGRLYRQNIITSSFATPDINAAFARLCASHAGAAKLVPEPGGVLSLVVPQARQLFERFSVAGGPSAVSDARFAFFKANVWPRVREAGAPGLLLFCPSYFDFVRLRNFLTEEGADFGALCEYTALADATRRRALFAQQRVRLLLYTERAHFYHRYRIRGIKDVLFYGLPDHAHFYSELLNLLEDAPSSTAGGHYATAGVLFCKYDALALGRVVGASRAKKMLTSASPSFVFC